MKQYIFSLAVYFMTIGSLTLKIIIYIAIVSPYHGKDIVDSLNAIDGFYLGRGMNRLSKMLNTNCEGLCMLHFATNKSIKTF